jgi:hypothetical protein
MGVQTKKNHRKKRSRTQKQKRGGGYLWDSPKEKLIKKTKKELKELIAEKEDINLVGLYHNNTKIKNSTQKKLNDLNNKIKEVKELLERYEKIPYNVKERDIPDYIEQIKNPTNYLSSPTNSSNSPFSDSSYISSLDIQSGDDIQDKTPQDKILKSFFKEQEQREQRTQIKQTPFGKFLGIPKDINDTKKLIKYRESYRINKKILKIEAARAAKKIEEEAEAKAEAEANAKAIADAEAEAIVAARETPGEAQAREAKKIEQRRKAAAEVAAIVATRETQKIKERKARAKALAKAR